MIAKSLFILIILFVVAVVSIICWRKSNQARNFVLTSEAVLQDLLNEAWGLLDVNPFIRGSHYSDLEEIGHNFSNMFYGINENSFDVCWVTKKKDISIFEQSIIDKISEIKSDIQIASEAKIQVPLLLESLPIKLSNVGKKIQTGTLPKDAKPHLDRAHGWFANAVAVMRQDQDHSLAWGMLMAADQELDLVGTSGT